MEFRILPIHGRRGGDFVTNWEAFLKGREKRKKIREKGRKRGEKEGKKGEMKKKDEKRTKNIDL